jgi:imidazolonepropionase-like amidohydrolase
MRKLLIPLIGLATLSAPVAAQRAAREPEPYALTGVRLLGETAAPRYTLLLKGGRIEALLPAAQEISREYRLLPAEDLFVVPTFVDSFSHAGIEMPAPNTTQDIPINTTSDVRIEMRLANRKGIQPEWVAATAYTVSDSDVEARRQAGFGAMLCAPHGEILSGISAAVLLGQGAPRDVILSDQVFGHAAFAASGSGYPGTLMGMHAQLRQFLMDSSWQAELRGRRELGLPGPRPAYDPSLQAGEELLQRKQRLICEAQSARDIRRWIALAEEFKLEIAIAGGREAWRVADELAAMGIPVILTLEWPKEVADPDAKKEKDGKEISDQAASEEVSEEPSVEAAKPEGAAKEKANWVYEEPLALKRERRRRWELLRDNGIRLQEAGVGVYFGSGSEPAKELMSQARALVEAGYPRTAMLKSMTADAAQWLGLSDELGSLTVGAGANVCLWTADPFDEKAKVRYSFVDGFLKQWEIKEDKAPDVDSDMSGTWNLSFSEGGMTGVFELKMDATGAISGEARVVSEGEEDVLQLSGQLSGKDFTLNVELDMEGMPIPLEITGTLDGDAFEASAEANHPVVVMEIQIKGVRKPKGDQS